MAVYSLIVVVTVATNCGYGAEPRNFIVVRNPKKLAIDRILYATEQLADDCRAAADRTAGRYQATSARTAANAAIVRLPLITAAGTATWRDSRCRGTT